MKRGKRTPLVVCGILLAVGVIGAAVFSWISSLIVLAVGIGILMIWYIQDKKQENELAKLSDEIDRVLHGQEETLQFSAAQEGTVGILVNEIYKMTVELREQNAELRKSHGFMKESLEDISHQLRTPLTSMVLLVNLLSKPSLSDAQRMGYVKNLANLNTRMQWLIETLLKISRLDAGVVQFRRQDISCEQLLHKALEPLVISAELKNVTIVLPQTADVTFQADFDRMVEAVGNILKNCIEHTPDGGRITISADANPVYTSISISDTGNGISEEDKPHIFERFYQSSEFAKNGYGIGLAYARQTVSAQNGTLTVDNIEPHGACFEMRMYHTVV